MEKGPNEMDVETEPQSTPPQSTPPQSRARTNSKLRVLGRSDAMREETSPPRDPPQSSPSIKLIPSANSSPNESTTPTLCNPLVVLSPSRSRGSSPCRGSTISSPTSTLVPSPKCRSSPQNVSPNFLEHSDVCCIQHMNAQDGGCYDRRCHDSNLHTCQKTIHNREESTCYCKCDETSQIKASSRRILRMERLECDSLKSCNKCLMNREKNINNNINSINNNFNNLSVHKNARGKLRQQSSSQGSSSNSPCLSRDSSSEYHYTDSSGTHLEHFIIETVNRNSRDRALMLRIETELVNLAKHPTQSRCTFPPMSSYERMCIHRVAAFFGMDHNVDATGRSVIVSKSSNTRVPVHPFASYFDEEMHRKILRRPDSMEEYNYKPLDRQSSLENRRSKSFEEREEDYNKARKRIFDREMHEFSSTEEFGWSEVPWSSTDSDNSSRFRLLHPERHTGRLLKVQSVESRGDLPRPCVAKSYSFGGYGGVSVLTRGDSVLSTHSAGPRLLTKQDSGASNVSWRLSPSSSGYKSQSLISESVTPSPTSTPNPPGESVRQDSANSSLCISTSEPSTPALEKDSTSETQLLWAVSDIHNVPKGSVIINPQNGKPVKNVDGSIYHYDPSNPPDIMGSVNMPNSDMDKSNSEEDEIKNACSSSPKKVRPKSSPTPNKKHNFIHTSTSPSLPLVPSTQSSRNSFSAPSELVSSPQYASGYGSGNPPLEGQVPFHYQPSPTCFVYASYGVPGSAQYDGRLDPQMPEVPGGYFVNEAGGAPASSQYWNQQPVVYYPSGTPPTFPPGGMPPARLPVSVGPSNSFMPPSFPPPNFAHSQSVPNIPHPSQHNPEYVPIYSSQPVPVLYQQPPHPNQGNPMMYPGHGLICTQNPVYHSVMVPFSNLPQNVTYPQNPPTPGSANPSPFCPPNQDHLAHNMGQLSIGPNQSIPFNHTMPPPPIPQQFDSKNQRPSKGNKFGYSKSLVSCSSQSSTGTNSPATTIISSNPGFVQYRTPPETPPALNNAFSFPQNYAMFPQMGNGRMNAHMNRSSRSPTPGSEGSQIDRSRFNQSFHGMPFAGPNGDSRNFQAYRQQQPSNYRSQNCNNQNGESFTNRNRKKYRGNKASSGLPPSGK